MYQLVAALIHAEKFFFKFLGGGFFSNAAAVVSVYASSPPSYTGLAYTYTNLQQIKDKCINASDGFFNGVAEKIVLGANSGEI